MTLLIFPPNNLAPSLAALLDPSLRKSVANSVNEAILVSQGAEREARLRRLVRLRAWAEKNAREAKKDLPMTLDLGLDLDKKAKGHGEDSTMHENGEAQSMVT